MMKKQIALVATAVVLVFGGCGDDRSHPKDGVDGKGGTTFGTPVAAFSVASVDHDYNASTSSIDFRASRASSPIIFDGNISYDRDEEGQSIQSYDWNITMSGVENCLDDVNTTGSRAIVKLCNRANNNGELNITLNVTDNEGAKSGTTKIITIK